MCFGNGSSQRKNDLCSFGVTSDHKKKIKWTCPKLSDMEIHVLASRAEGQVCPWLAHSLPSSSMFLCKALIPSGAPWSWRDLRGVCARPGQGPGRNPGCSGAWNQIRVSLFSLYEEFWPVKVSVHVVATCTGPVTPAMETSRPRCYCLVPGQLSVYGSPQTLPLASQGNGETHVL